MIHLQLRTNKKYEIQSAAEYGSLNSPSDLNRTGYLIHLECEKIQQATLSFFSKVWEKTIWKAQCGKYKNSLSLRFYVKSMSDDLEVQNLPFNQL